VATPERGTISDSATVTVTGTVTDDGDVTVAVNGTPATVAPDGTFSATVTVAPGVEVLETIATDAAGNEDRDVRAVMSGNLAPTDGHVSDAVGARVGAAAFNVISGVVGDTVNGLDLGAIAQPLNPVVSEGGSCLGVDIDVTDASIGNFTIDLTPAPGDLEIAAMVSDLEIDLHAHFHVACIGGNDDIVIYASRVWLSGGLGLAAGGGTLHATVDGLQISIDGLYLDVGGLPDSVVNLFADQIADIVAETMTTMVNEKVPPMVEQALTEMSGKSWNLAVLDRNIGIGVTPTAVLLDYDGAFVALDTRMQVYGGEGGVYVSNPEPMSASMMTTDGLGLAVSDDALNQLFAGLWASGGLDQELAIDVTSPAALILGPDTKVVKIGMLLPPTVSMDESGDLRLTVGDLLIQAQDADGGEVMTLALSLSTTLGAETTEDDHVALRLGEPTVFAQILFTDPRQTPLLDSDVESLVETVFPMVSQMANHAMSALPLPSVMGVSLESPTLESRAGYVMLQTGVGF
jgi:hypothetical protein